MEIDESTQCSVQDQEDAIEDNIYFDHYIKKDIYLDALFHNDDSYNEKYRKIDTYMTDV